MVYFCKHENTGPVLYCTPNLIVRTLAVAQDIPVLIHSKRRSDKLKLDPEMDCDPHTLVAVLYRGEKRAHDGHDDRRTETEMHQSQRLLR